MLIKTDFSLFSKCANWQLHSTANSFRLSLAHWNSSEKLMGDKLKCTVGHWIWSADSLLHYRGLCPQRSFRHQILVVGNIRGGVSLWKSTLFKSFVGLQEQSLNFLGQNFKPFPQVKINLIVLFWTSKIVFVDFVVWTRMKITNQLEMFISLKCNLCPGLLLY